MVRPRGGRRVSAYTPGPWVVDDRPTYAADAGMNAQPIRKGACIADVSTGFSTHSIHAPATIGRQCPSVAEMNAQGLANAQLIAAAPELLAALHAALSLIHEYEPESTSFGATQASAAIAKAEGRA